jgi:HTH-type transcriptional regulator/antitoxin HigA
MKILGLPIPPGDTIKEQLDTWGVSQKDFALRMDYTEKHIIDILKGKIEITTEIANRLENVLGISSRFWLGLEQNYRLSLKRKEEEDKIEDDELILKNIPYNDMVKHNWIEPSKNSIEKIRNLRSYFGVAKLSKITQTENVAFRISTKFQSSNYAIAAWLRKGQIDIRENTNFPEFDRTLILSKVIPNILCTLIFETNIEKIKNSLTDIFRQAGIYFTITTNISKTGINGALTWINKHPLIQMSLKGKYSDIFWFTVFHELGHIYYEHSKKEVILDLVNESTGSEIIEKQADSFAIKHLYPYDYSTLIKKHPISKNDICEFSKKHNLPTGIIVGRLMHDKIIDWSMFSELREKF